MSGDLRYAFRQFGRQRGFTVAAVATLALGIGANTAIFSVVHGVLLRPLPYPEPNRIVAVWESNPDPAWGQRSNVTDGNFLDWRDRNTVFTALGAYSGGFGLAAIGTETPAEVTTVRVTPSVFEVLGVGAHLGRVFLPEDGLASGDRIVLLSHHAWRNQFGGDSGIVGRTVLLEEQPFTVVGVMPPWFDFPNRATDVWIPLRIGEGARQSRAAHRWRVVGRLEAGVTVERAQAEMDAIAAHLRADYPQFMRGWSISVVPFRADLVRSARPLLLILLGIVGVLLLIASANVANLFLARAIHREHEFALRLALGGTRWRIARQLLAEAGVLAVVGVVAGVSLAALGVGVLLSMAPSDIPRLEGVGIDSAVLAYVAVAAALSTLLFGLLPAWRASRTDLGIPLRAARRTGGSLRQGQLREILLVGELALSMVLLVGAGLLIRSFQQLQAVDHGFEPGRLLAAGINLPHARYQDHGDREAFYARAIEQLAALPHVESVAGTTEPPIVGFNDTFTFAIDGRNDQGPVEAPVVTPGFFQTMQIPLLQGRGFTAFDRAGQPDVAVVNETFARRFLPGENALGRRISFDGTGGPWVEVVGVVGDTRHYGLDKSVEPVIYLAYAQNRRDWLSWMTLMIRTRGEPLSVAPDVRRTIWDLDARLALRLLAPVTELYAESSARRRFAAALTGSFAGVALLLGLIGIFGVVSYGVAQRRREFGVRLALGADGPRIVRSVLRHGLVLAGAGVAAGIVGAIILTRLLRTLLFGVTPTDPLTFTITALLLIGVAVLACWIPARRAARTNPMEALRQE